MNTAAKITAAQWQASAALFGSLCDPAQRALSYRALITAGRPLLFASRANACYPHRAPAQTNMRNTPG